MMRNELCLKTYKRNLAGKSEKLKRSNGKDKIHMIIEKIRILTKRPTHPQRKIYKDIIIENMLK